MSIQKITPINSLEQLAQIKETKVVSTSNENPFKSIFENALSDVKESSEAWNQEIVKLATGESDNLHDVMIASTKYTMSVELLVQLRNKALDAYNEIMNMGV